MSQPAKFLFDNDFETAPAVVEVNHSELEAEICELRGQLQSEKKRAYDEGFAAGKKAGESEALQGIEASISQSVDQIGAQICNSFSRLDEIGENSRRDAIRVATTAALKLCSKQWETDPAKGLFPFLEETLGEFRGEQNLSVFVAEEIAPMIEERLRSDGRLNAMRDQLSIQTDERLTPGDSIVEWQDCRVEFMPSKLADMIEARINDYLGINETKLEDVGPDQEQSAAVQGPGSLEEEATTETHASGDNHER